MDPHEDHDQCLITVRCPLIYPKWPGEFSPEYWGLFGRILQVNHSRKGTKSAKGAQSMK
jgi:hypothetical protein